MKSLRLLNKQQIQALEDAGILTLNQIAEMEEGSLGRLLGSISCAQALIAEAKQYLKAGDELKNNLKKETF